MTKHKKNRTLNQQTIKALILATTFAFSSISRTGLEHLSPFGFLTEGAAFSICRFSSACADFPLDPLVGTSLHFGLLVIIVSEAILD